ncbi:1,4-alpha-glucan branching protein GlgB [candidate division GN15 bacterium]|nr:1,4-alpha-glucan branching protein GlgB [candidate division GN15 bacterium]
MTQTATPVIHGPTRFSDQDTYLFKQGSHYQLYDKLGSRPITHDGKKGVHFAVWAPNARSVAVMGDFNGWNRSSHQLAVRWDGSGVWEGFVPGLNTGSIYKYFVRSNHNNWAGDKGDPFAFHWETPPKTGSIVWSLDYTWNDQTWMRNRAEHNKLDAPWSVYEVHLGSWRRIPEDGNRSLSYRELAPKLAQYVSDMGFTHVEFLPVTEHPFFGSWGYQSTGYFAPTSRYGTPQDLMYLIDYLHQNGIGVILDIVPSHFPSDQHGLVYFDGTHLYEHQDPRKGFHPDWKSYIFNYGRNEVRNFLISSALFWLDKYHIDGLRVDGVASMLYLDYSREHGEWVANEFGGRENVEAISFLRRMNEVVYEKYPDVQTIAEESTAWPMVSRPVYVGGLGFGMKWNMGWMHDTLEFFTKEPIHRKYHHNNLTFSLLYAFTENFKLPLSHDEVVHGKGSLIGKMSGDHWQKRANLRLLLGYMWTHPGKNLLFMGGEIGQWQEWNHEGSVQWDLLEYDDHLGIKRWVKDLNHYYRSTPALFEADFQAQGFDWVDCNDVESSVLSFLRAGKNGRPTVLVAANFTPVPRAPYRIGVPFPGHWKEVLNSDAQEYGGSGCGNLGGVNADDEPLHGLPHSVRLSLPPLGLVVLECQGSETDQSQE